MPMNTPFLFNILINRLIVVGVPFCFVRKFAYMSVELVKEQVRRFLSTDTPEVLAIKGDWGSVRLIVGSSTSKSSKSNAL